MADAAGLNPAAARRGGSNPSSGTTSARIRRSSERVFARRILAGLGNPRVGMVGRIGRGALSYRVLVLRLLAGVVVERVARHRRPKSFRRSWRLATGTWSIPITACATRRIAAAAGEAGRAMTSGTPSLTERIISTSV